MEFPRRLAASVLCGAVIFSVGVAHSTLATDPFVGTIQRLKRSVAPVVCLSPKPDGTAAYIGTVGTAFFTTKGGQFLTAAHVLSADVASAERCPVSALYLPLRGWTDEPTFDAVWLRFAAAECVIDTALDVGQCQTEVAPASKGLNVVPVAWQTTPPSDGTPVAFTGFPLEVVRPVTARASLAAFQPGLPGADLLIDKSAWPGVSGGPVYLENGDVIGMVLRRGQSDALGLTFARSSARLQQFLKSHAERRWQRIYQAP